MEAAAVVVTGHPVDHVLEYRLVTAEKHQLSLAISLYTNDPFLRNVILHPMKSRTVICL